MANLTTAKIAQVMFDDALDTFSSQSLMLEKVDFYEPDGAAMQNSGNTVIRPVRQQRPVIDGWDLSGSETDIIEQAYLATLGTPKNDFAKLRADDLRDPHFWDNAGMESGKKQISTLNKAIADAIVQQGSLFYRSNDTSGYDFISEAQAQMNERQLANNGRCFMLNDRVTKKFGEDLAGRQTLQGRPAETWNTGQIGANVAQFDLYTGSFLSNLVGGADPATTVTGNQSFAPLAGTVVGNVVTNNDYRYADIPVAASGGYNVGDKVSIANAGTPVYALGKDDKTNTVEAMTFTVVDKPDATTITVSPRPIALDDAALSVEEAAYANIDTQILNGATVNRLNTVASEKTNIFWDKSAVEVLGGTIPAMYMSTFEGKKVLSETMPNGLTMYMFYDGEIEGLTFRWRIFTWYNVIVKDPANCGVAISY